MAFVYQLTDEYRPTSAECTLSHCTGLQHIRILGTRPIGSPSTFRNTFGVLSQMTNVPTFLARVRAPNVLSVHFVHLPRWITKDYGSWVGQSLAALSANSALSRTVRKVAFEIYGQEFKERDEDSEAEQRRRIREACYGSPEFIRDAWAQHWRTGLTCEIWWSGPSAIAAIWELDRTSPAMGAELMAVSCDRVASEHTIPETNCGSWTGVSWCNYDALECRVCDESKRSCFWIVIIGEVEGGVTNVRWSLYVPCESHPSYALLRSCRISEPISSALRPSIHCIASGNPHCQRLHPINFPRPGLTAIGLRDDHPLERRPRFFAPREAEVVRALLGARVEVHNVGVHPHVLCEERQGPSQPLAFAPEMKHKREEGWYARRAQDTAQTRQSARCWTSGGGGNRSGRGARRRCRPARGR